MKRTLVISDIHGEIDLFEELLIKANYNSKDDQLILLGDYVDRGPNAKKVLEKVRNLKSEGAIVLKGNHEDMMIKALTTYEPRAWKHWVYRNGGDITLESYGFGKNDYRIEENVNFPSPFIHSEVLANDLQFIQTLDTIIEWDSYIFVHAGIEPEKPIELTDPYTFMWIRDAFYNHYQGKKTVIFGHTPTPYLHEDKTNYTVFFGDNPVIGVDGAATYGGQLNCLELPNMKVYAVQKKR